MPKALLGIFCVLIFLSFPGEAGAVTIASQTNYNNPTLDVWQAIQELGTSLSGTAQSFTFRVSTLRSNSNQFDHTAENSRIYDKTNNRYVLGCVPAGSNPNNMLRGLTFNTAGVPDGYEDVTIDFSCRNYNFTNGYRYLIKISNANRGNQGSGKMLFAASSYSDNTDYFPDGGLRYATGNPYDHPNNSGICDPTAYVWNGTNPYHNGCYVWNNPKNDLYFVLENNAPPPPPPRLPVVFIPGIGGSELKASQNIFWSDQDNGHGGRFSYAYQANEKIWVNQDKAVEFGDDDYFDVLRLKSDGVTSEADLSLTGSLTSFGYGEIDSFFTNMGYTKGTNFFVFPYDWRKDIRSNKDNLDSLIEQAKTSSGQSKVNLVTHSMGGLITRYYISDSTKASKVNKLIELGVPHLGAVEDIKAIVYGLPLGKPVLKFFNIGISGLEVKDVFQNLPSAFQLLPSRYYFDFYDGSNTDLLYPFRDERDIDNNKITGNLNFDQVKNLLENLGHNMTVFNFADPLHNSIQTLFQNNIGVELYIIAGSNQPTLGQINETWWITWPITLISKRDEIFINGDGTVPLYSASLKSSSKDYSAGATIYYTEQEHVDLVSSNGVAMQTVKSILNDDNALPVEVKSFKVDLEGDQLSLDEGELELYDDEGRHTGINDNGEIEENIAETFYSASGKTKHAFVKKKAKKVTVRVTNSRTTNLKIRKYKQDKISKTILYKDILLSENDKVEFELDPSLDTAPSFIAPTAQVSADTLDQTPPATKIETSGTNPVTITLTGSDLESGILRIEYSLDNGQTVQTYTEPFTITTPGKTTIQVKSIDNSGNEEIPQTITIEIASQPTPAPTPIPTTSTTSETNATSTATNAPNEPRQSQNSISSPPEVLGINFENPSHISDQINASGILNEIKNPEPKKIITNSAKQILGGLLIISGGIVTIASLGLITTFLKPIPK